MTKQTEALHKALHKALKVLNCLNNNRVYETAWVKGAINACEEALEQEKMMVKYNIKTENKKNVTHGSQTEALKMAIEALDESMPLVFGNGIALEIMKTPLLEVERKVNFHKKAIQACKEALEQPEQEPVALVIEDKLADWSKPYVAVKWNKVDFEIGTEFYTHPAPSWQGLSDDEKQEAIDEAYKNFKEYCRHKVTQDINEKDGIEYWVARAIEQALRIKNAL